MTRTLRCGRRTRNNNNGTDVASQPFPSTAYVPFIVYDLIGVSSMIRMGSFPEAAYWAACYSCVLILF